MSGGQRHPQGVEPERFGPYPRVRTDLVGEGGGQLSTCNLRRAVAGGYGVQAYLERRLAVALEPGDQLARRGLPDAEPFSRPAEMTLLGDRDETRQLAQLHGATIADRSRERDGCDSWFALDPDGPGGFSGGCHVSPSTGGASDADHHRPAGTPLDRPQAGPGPSAHRRHG